MNKINWIEVQEKYNTGLYSMKQLAAEYKFNSSYGLRKAKQNNWAKGSTRNLVKKEVQQQVIELKAVDEIKAKGQYYYLVESIRNWKK